MMSDRAPTFLVFSLRLAQSEPMGVLAEKVGAALGCEMVRGQYAQAQAFVGDVFGMQIGLLLWGGLHGKPTYQLHGGPLDADAADTLWNAIDIDAAVADLLARRGAGRWYMPSVEEKTAEGDYGGIDD